MVFCIFSSLILWLKPPSVSFKMDNTGTGSNTPRVNFTMDGVTIPLKANISVNNPNYISAKLDKLQMELIYPTRVASVPLGEVSLQDITFNTNSRTNFTLSLDIDYQYKVDPRRSVLIDVAQKCGILRNKKSKLRVELHIKANVRVLSTAIRPTISTSFEFDCPIEQGVIEAMRQQVPVFLVANEDS
ncbi:hypothetical protein VNI00_000168 [Paramarasmius palmivorus]|uniref:Late embryogenesis abundant protein LEA-2 subgroup domain-containing protein n=1 Tax=Paramarasmius palmivorus TaxID=297713 RepID=A0AAW0EER4_9AGAR